MYYIAIGGAHMTTLTIRMPENLKEELEKLAKEENIPAGRLVRESIDRYLSIMKFKKIRKKILPFAEAQGLITDEDIFKALKR
jgi:predicted transcriptional regulator